MSSTKPAKVAKTKSKPKPSPTPTTISDFIVLPLSLPSVSGLPETYQNAKHYLYVKQHTPTHATASADRSLFLANIPIDASESNVRALFAEQLGGSRVESVDFDSAVPSAPQQKRWKDVGNKASGEQRGKKRKRNDEDIVAEGVVEDAASALPKIWGEVLRESGSTAVVMFVDERSCKGAWKEIQKLVKEGSSVQWKGGEAGMLGLQRYTTHHTLKYPSKETLQSSINAYLVQFNRAELARNRLRSKQRSVPDEDGFITVVRGGRTGPARLEDAEKKKVELEERRKKNGVRDDFYRFQTREKRKEAEGELRRKFEVDRRRVEEMRARRGGTRPQT
jgi:ribosomal RNA-processing protein 7